jgi:hypothetical protein
LSIAIERFNSTRNEKIHQYGAVREVAKDVGARQRLLLEQHGSEADTVGLRAIWMEADVTYLEADCSPVEPREERFAVARRRRGIRRRSADVEHELDGLICASSTWLW